MKDRRIGKVTVADRLLRAAIDSGHGANMFAGSVPLDVQRSWVADKTTFVLWHPKFQPVDEGRMIPEYRAVFEDGETTPTWEHIEGT